MKKIRAFTLLELLLTVAMLAILGLVLGPILKNVIVGSSLVSSRQQVLAEARNGMERMVQEIRLIPSTAVLASITATNLQFQYPTGTSIVYTLSGLNLLRNSDIMIGNVNSLAFTYYDSLGNITASAINVRSIGILFTVLSPGDNSTLKLQTRVFLRNTGHNYADFTSP